MLRLACAVALELAVLAWVAPTPPRWWVDLLPHGSRNPDTSHVSMDAQMLRASFGIPSAHYERRTVPCGLFLCGATVWID